MQTRSRTSIPIIGQLIESLAGDVLPTIIEVLRVYFFHHVIKKSSQKDSIKTVVEEVLEIWSKVSIPICLTKNAVRKLQAHLATYRNIIRNTKRCSATQRDREAQFRISITHLFDISQINSFDLIDREDELFLEDQRMNREFVLTQIHQTTNRKADRESIKPTRLEKEANDSGRCAFSELITENEVDSLTLSLSQLSSHDGSIVSHQDLDLHSDDFSCSAEQTYNRQVKRTKTSSADSLLSEDVSMALNRTNISNAKAVHVLSAVAVNRGINNLDDVSLSISTVRRWRISHRNRRATSEKSDFKCKEPLVLHSHGKLLPALSGTPNKEDRIAVILSGQGVEKLLGVPRIDSGKAALIAKVCYSMVDEWNFQNNIVGLSFDTTAVNTGMKSYACVTLERKLGKNLIWLACRHHVFEIICRSVFTTAFGSTDGPSVTLFKRFKAFWHNIDQHNYTA